MGKKPAPNPVIMQAPVAEPAPPVTQTSPEVIQAGQDVRQQELMKKNMRQTVKAGDTGGFRRPQTKVNPAGGNPFVAPQGKF